MGDSEPVRDIDATPAFDPLPGPAPQSVQPTVRPVAARDLPALYRMNNLAVPHVTRVDLDMMRWYANHAAQFLVAELDGPKILGFVIVLPSECPYKSPNYLWFKNRYQSFLYIDRIVVSDTARRHGVGHLLYKALIAFAVPRVKHLCAEVNVRPRNYASLRFHDKLGFVRVGVEDVEDGHKTVVFLTKTLEKPASA